MDGFRDPPLLGPGHELQLTIDDGAISPAEVLAAAEVLEADKVLAHAFAREETVGEAGEGLELKARENLYAAGGRLATCAATPATRRQYAAIYRSFADWLRGELGRPPIARDVDGDGIAAYARHLELRGGRGGRPAALATRRVYLSMVRALARELGADDVAAAGVRVPRHRAGPPRDSHRLGVREPAARPRPPDPGREA